jgi:hypothetical protein
MCDMKQSVHFHAASPVPAVQLPECAATMAAGLLPYSTVCDDEGRWLLKVALPPIKKGFN